MKKNDKKINIGLFNDTFYPMIDGVVSVVHNYAKELSKYANVYVFVPKIPKKKFDDSTLPYKVIRSKSMSVPFLDYACPTPDFDSKFKKELNNYNLDIIHVHSPVFIGKMAIRYAKKHNIPVIATMHSQYKQDLERAVKFNGLANLINKKFFIKTLNKCDECWAVNSEVARIFYEDYGYKEMPRVMNNATEMALTNDLKKSKDKINKLHNIKNDEKVFLYVGRINKLKYVIFLANSLKILKDKNPNFKWKMLYVGSGQDEGELRKDIKDNKMEKDIIMCGSVSDRDLLRDYFARADLFLFPSMYDSSSIVQIEAASQKTPGVYLEGAATAATIKNNKNGFISKPTEEEFASRVIEIMNDEKKLKEVSENAYKEVYVSWEDKVKEAYNLYCKLIDKNKESN